MTVTDNPSIMIDVNKIENRITFKIKTWYYHQLLMPETTKLLGSTKSKINKNKNSKKCASFRNFWSNIIHCNIVNNDYQRDLRVLYAFVPNKSLVNY